MHGRDQGVTGVQGQSGSRDRMTSLGLGFRAVLSEAGSILPVARTWLQFQWFGPPKISKVILFLCNFPSIPSA